MEKSLLLKSISEPWMSLSSKFMPMYMTFAIMCGVGLFILLIPFLKTYPESPPPGSKRNTPKVVKKGQVKTRKRSAAVKGCRDDRKNVKETQNPSQPMEIPTKHPLLDSMPYFLWNPKEKMDHLPLSQLLSYLKVLENIIQQKFSQLFWGISSVLSESMVATALVSQTPSSAGPKSMSLSDIYGPFPAVPLAQGPPRLSQAQPLPHHLMAQSLVDMTKVQTLYKYPFSTPNQISSSSKTRTCGIACPATETRIWASPPTENQPWQPGLKWRYSIGSNVQKHQAAISQPSHNFPWGILPTEAIRSASILPEQCQVLHHQEEPQSEHTVTTVGEQGSHFRKLMQPPGHFPALCPHQTKNRPDVSQPSQSSILNSKNYTLSQMMRSVPLGMPLKTSPVNSNKHDPIKEHLHVGAKDLPSTSSNTPVEDLEPRDPSLRTDQLSYVNTAQNLFFLDPMTQMKLESNIKQLPRKHKRPYLQTFESRYLVQWGDTVSSLPQPVHPSSATCVSKAEYCPKAVKILEKLHHRDPGGTRVGTVSVARLFGPSKVQETQRAPPPAASHEPSKADPDACQSNLSARANAYCLLARTQPSRTIRGTGRGSQKPRASPITVRHEPWKRSESVASGHPWWRGTIFDPETKTPPSVIKQTHRTVAVSKETLPPWRMSFRYSKIPNGQNINISLRNFESVEANRFSGHFRVCRQHSGGPALNPQVLSGVDLRTNKHPQSWPTELLPDCQSLVHPATVSLPSEDLLSKFQKRSQSPKSPQGLGDMFMERDHNQETWDLSVPKRKIPASSHKTFHPNEERRDFMRSRTKSRRDRLRGVQLSQSCGLLTPTQLKDMVIIRSQSSLCMPVNQQVPAEPLLKKIVKNILQCLNLERKDKEQGHSQKTKRPPPSTVQTKEECKRQKLIHNIAAEAQSLLNVVVQLLVNRLGLTVEGPSKAQRRRVETPLTFQLGCSSPPSEGLYGTKCSRPRRTNCDHHTNSKKYNHPSTYRGTGHKHQSGVGSQRAYAHHQKRAKKGTSFEQHPTPKGNKHSCRYRGTGDKQQPDTASETAHDQDQIRMKSGMCCRPHTSPKGHNHPIRDKRSPGLIQDEPTL